MWVHDIDSTTVQSMIANLLLPTHIFWSRWPIILLVLCTSVHLLFATSHKLMCLSLLLSFFVQVSHKCSSHISWPHTSVLNPQCFCFLFSCPVSWCYYLSISSQDHGLLRLLEQMITVRDLTSPFITPTQAYMCTLTNILAVLPPTQQHTRIIPKKPKIFARAFWNTHRFSLFVSHLCTDSQSTALTLWASDQNSFSVL